MNPVLALGLVAAAGVAIARLPRLSPRHSSTFDLVFAAGTPLVLLGVLLGPGIELLAPPVLRALAPVTALAVGLIGAVFGARFEWRYVHRIPWRVWLLVVFQSAAAFAVVGLAAWLFTRLVPALAAAWSPALPAILTLAAVAAVSGPDAVARVVHALGVRRPVAQTFGLAAALETAFGAFAFMLVLALYPPRELAGGAGGAGGAGPGWYTWLALAVGSGIGVGVLFLGLTRLIPEREGLGLRLVGVLLLGAGIGYAANLSPFVVCALAAAVIVNGSPLRRQVLAALHTWEHPIYAIFLIIVGALLTLPTAWIFLAVPALAALRVAAKWTAARYGREPLRVPALPPHLGLATLAQGGVAVALGINFFLTYGADAPEAAGAVVTTILLGALLAQALALPLMGLALRPARLTGAAPAAEVT